jgi:hypothetical protein
MIFVPPRTSKYRDYDRAFGSLRSCELGEPHFYKSAWLTFSLG